MSFDPIAYLKSLPVNERPKFNGPIQALHSASVKANVDINLSDIQGQTVNGIINKTKELQHLVSTKSAQDNIAAQRKNAWNKRIEKEKAREHNMFGTPEV